MANASQCRDGDQGCGALESHTVAEPTAGSPTQLILAREAAKIIGCGMSNVNSRLTAAIVALRPKTVWGSKWVVDEVLTCGRVALG